MAHCGIALLLAPAVARASTSESWRKVTGGARDYWLAWEFFEAA